VIGADDPALEQAPKSFNRIGVNEAAHVPPATVADR
jgi:hypothetical protein